MNADAPSRDVTMKNADPESVGSIWPHRFALALVLLVWPLIWVGGLVTTYDAGMSVPDWPGTYGYNLFLYPLSTWLWGPFDLFIEHGHRLLASLVGLVAIGFLVSCLMSESRRWVQFLAGLVLLVVIGQGVLGGLRVTMSERTFAMIHGCLGPAFFALCVVAACVTSRRWNSNRVAAEGRSPADAESMNLRRDSGQGSETSESEQPVQEKAGFVPAMVGLTIPIALWVMTYGQLVLGAQLRHALPSMSPGGFAHTAVMHVLVAFLLAVLSLWGWWRIRGCGDLTLSRPAAALICFVCVQTLLGIATWIVNYGYPAILQFLPGSDSYQLRSKDVFDAWIVTGHVATGSLILAVATLLVVRTARRRHVLFQQVSS